MSFCTCCPAATVSLFVEEFLKFCFRSTRFCLDIECKTFVSVYVNDNQFAIFLMISNSYQLVPDQKE